MFASADLTGFAGVALHFWIRPSYWYHWAFQVGQMETGGVPVTLTWCLASKTTAHCCRTPSWWVLHSRRESCVCGRL